MQQLVLRFYYRFNNINIFINRLKGYNPAGRMQSEIQAQEKDREILNMLHQHNIPHEVIDGGSNWVEYMTEVIALELSRKEQ